MIFSKAQRLNERGRELAEKGWFVEAEEAYRAAAKAKPQWSVPWYNLGLLHKYRGKVPRLCLCRPGNLNRPKHKTPAQYIEP